MLTALQAQRDEAGSDSEQLIAELEQRQVELDRKLQQELTDLAAMEREAEQRTRAAAEERQANCALVRKRLDESLGQLAGEEQALRQKLAARD